MISKASALPATGALMAAALLVAGLSCRQTASRQACVVVYCSADQEVAEPILAEFERQTGIKVQARFDTEASKTVGLVQRLRAERASPVADVFWSSEVFYTIRLAREGLLASGATTQPSGWPKHLVDPEGRWIGFAMRARVIAYNTTRLSAEQAPKRLEDLLDGKWKGRLVMARPQFGTTGGDVASWFAHYGPQQARRILQGLADNKVLLVDGNSTSARLVATGQADVGLTDTDDVYAEQRNGRPIAMHLLDQGGAGPLAIPNTAAVVKGSPNPEQARALLTFLLGGRAETMLAESHSHNSPVSPGVAGRFPQYRIEQSLEISYEKVADELPNALTAAAEILR